MTQDAIAVGTHRRPRNGRPRVRAAAIAAIVACGLVIPAGATLASSSPQPAAASRAAAAECSVGLSGAAVPTQSSGTAAVRTTIGVAKTMGVPVKGQIIAVMVMFQESSLRNLANDGTTTQASWPAPGKDYWLSVTRLSLKYPHDKFGTKDGAHDTDSIGLYQQRPAYGWGNYGDSTGTTDPEGAVQRLLDPRWEAMAFFGGARTAAPKGGLMDVAGWQTMAPTVAADAVQQSNHPDFYAQWETPATNLVNNNQDAPPIDLPWVPGGGRGALACTSIPTDPALGEAGRNAFGTLDAAWIEGTGIRVAGWMLDPDAINGIGIVHFYDQGPFGTIGYPTGVANQTRDDVNRAFNVLGQHGYTATLPWNGAGQHTICGYAINIGRGTGNQQIGCRTVIVPGPVGSLDSAGMSAAGKIDVSGWAADPASPGAREEVHVYVTGPAGTSGTPGNFTGDPRADVSRALPWAGANQGFHATVNSMGEGANLVCLYAINVRPPSNNPGIGCRTVAVRTYPFGAVDSVAVTGNKAQVTGWTVDPASPATSIQVHIYVTSAGGQSVGEPFVANDARADVNAVVGVGGRHGYSRQVTLYPGVNTVCAYGIGTISGHNTQIACRTVTAGAAALAAPSPLAAGIAEAPAGASGQRSATGPGTTAVPGTVPPAKAVTPATTATPATTGTPTPGTTGVPGTAVSGASVLPATTAASSVASSSAPGSAPTG